MSPKEKCDQLIDRFLPHASWGMEDAEYVGRENAKQCAIICVEQIIEVLNKQDDPGNGVVIYWKEVLKKIKLITN